MSHLRKAGLKRKADELIANGIDKKKMNSGGVHWNLALLGSMNDPNLKVKEDELCVVIKDKYPKAKYHFLVIPKEKIQNLRSLNKGHASLLQHLDKTGKEITKSINTSAHFKYGYHAIPSLSQVHMHVISDDFDSDCLKTKKHWNSFNTDYFISSSDVMSRLEEKGEVAYDRDRYMALLKQNLKCHKCDEELKTIPALKLHIKTHIK